MKPACKKIYRFESPTSFNHRGHKMARNYMLTGVMNLCGRLSTGNHFKSGGKGLPEPLVRIFPMKT